MKEQTASCRREHRDPPPTPRLRRQSKATCPSQVELRRRHRGVNMLPNTCHAANQSRPWRHLTPSRLKFQGREMAASAFATPISIRDDPVLAARGLSMAAGRSAHPVDREIFCGRVTGRETWLLPMPCGRPNPGPDPTIATTAAATVTTMVRPRRAPCWLRGGGSRAIKSTARPP